jgi:hypothetical protein
LIFPDGRRKLAVARRKKEVTMHEPLLDFIWIALAFVLSAPLLADHRRRDQPKEQRERVPHKRS